MALEDIDGISPELIDQIKKQVIQEMRDEKKLEEEEKKFRQQEERELHEQYVIRMKNSPDPWVEVVGWNESDQGVKVELEWNPPFIKLLRDNGISGADDDQVVQKWLILMMHDLTNNENEEIGEYE